MYDNKETDYSLPGGELNDSRVAHDADDDVFGDESSHQVAMAAQITGVSAN